MMGNVRSLEDRGEDITPFQMEEHIGHRRRGLAGLMGGVWEDSAWNVRSEKWGVRC